MRIAIPIWEEKVSPVFDTALKLLVVEVKDKREESRVVYHIDENDLSQKCHRIRKLELDTLICGAVSHVFLQMLLASARMASSPEWKYVPSPRLAKMCLSSVNGACPIQGAPSAPSIPKPHFEKHR